MKQKHSYKKQWFGVKCQRCGKTPAFHYGGLEKESRVFWRELLGAAAAVFCIFGFYFLLEFAKGLMK